jgi:hypothetical protein
MALERRIFIRKLEIHWKKNSFTSSRLEPTTFPLVAKCLKSESKEHGLNSYVTSVFIFFIFSFLPFNAPYLKLHCETNETENVRCLTSTPPTEKSIICRYPWGAWWPWLGSALTRPLFLCWGFVSDLTLDWLRTCSSVFIVSNKLNTLYSGSQITTVTISSTVFRHLTTWSPGETLGPFWERWQFWFGCRPGKRTQDCSVGPGSSS